MDKFIWDAKFNGIDLTMKNMFNKPKSKMYSRCHGCFVHPGLLSNGCPSPEIFTHPMHGRILCRHVDKVWIEITIMKLLYSEYEYCQGFGYHYIVQPSITGTDEIF